jgi:hypothetical protein
MSAKQTLKRNPLLAWREIDGGVVIISPEDHRIHELNVTASFVWKQVDGCRTVEDIAELLMEEFDTGREAAIMDIDQLASSLEEKRLLQRISSPATADQNV